MNDDGQTAGVGGEVAAGAPPGEVPAGASPGEFAAGAPPGEVVLDIRSLSKSYGQTVALEDVDLGVRRGELVTLLGPSGSGKTTLLKLIAGFESPSSGEMRLRGRDIAALSPAQRGVGMVFQHYALFPHMTVERNIGYGLKLRRRPRAERERRVKEMLSLLRLEGLHDRYPRQLSGGQQQRVALGRALAYDPEVILMDEPLGALDRTLRIEMEQEIRALHRRLGATIVYVTHDQQEALALSDRIAVMREGKVAGLGSPASLYERPPNSFVAGFFAGANLLAVQAYETLADGTAHVRCAGGELRCASTVPKGEDAVLVVRRRSLRLGGSPGGGDLRLAGTLAELTPLGDEQELSLAVPGTGTVVAVLDRRDCVGLVRGAALALYAAADEAVLVRRGS